MKTLFVVFRTTLPQWVCTYKFFMSVGYGVGFPKNSMWIPKFNEYLMRYRENGDLERMQRFWFTGACEPRKRRRTSSKPLALAQVCPKICNKYYVYLFVLYKDLYLLSGQNSPQLSSYQKLLAIK